tara:strand:+ start:52 stop:642 length:591 start_codon:yes stop_codon:yes gene_type:complete
MFSKYLFKKFIQILLSVISFSFAQMENDEIPSRSTDWFISFSYGAQISGIKSEDFIQSNVTPDFTLGLGKWITPKIALQIGYSGFYFHYISDNDRHYYNFIYGDVLFNINKIIDSKKITKGKWNLIFHPGGGYFYNNYYNRPNICANLGLLYSFSFKNNFNLIVDVSAIAGWDIYQGNEDILPSCNIGIVYSFRVL